jgi:heat shock protein HspQ
MVSVYPKEVRPRKDQPFYHLLAESNDVTYEAYVSEQNLLLGSIKRASEAPAYRRDLFRKKRLKLSQNI